MIQGNMCALAMSILRNYTAKALYKKRLQK